MLTYAVHNAVVTDVIENSINFRSNRPKVKTMIAELDSLIVLSRIRACIVESHY